jgi:hypothetical protein
MMATGSDMNRLLETIVSIHTTQIQIQMQAEKPTMGVVGSIAMAAVGLAYYGSVQLWGLIDGYANMAVAFMATVGGGMALASFSGGGFYFPSMDNIYILRDMKINLSVGLGGLTMLISGNYQGVAAVPSISFSGDYAVISKFLWDKPSDLFINR